MTTDRASNLIPIPWDVVAKLRLSRKSVDPEVKKVLTAAIKEIGRVKLEARTARSQMEAYRVLYEGCRSHPRYRGKSVARDDCERCQKVMESWLAVEAFSE